MKRKKGSGVSQQPSPKEMNKKEVYMKHEEKPFKRDRRISQRTCRVSETKFHFFLLLQHCKDTHFFATLFFLSTKSFDGRAALAFSNDADARQFRLVTPRICCV